MTPEEALRHALLAEMERLPPVLTRGMDPAQMAADHLAGKDNRALRVLMKNAEVGHPSYEPKNQDEANLKWALLGDYTGSVWLPEQVEEFKRDNKGRAPTSNEMSPGGKMADSIEERHRLFEDLKAAREGGMARPERHGWGFGLSPGAWAGNVSPESEMKTAAANYAAGIDRKEAASYNDLSFMLNPGNWVGNTITKTLGVGPDIGSQWATARNTGQPDDRAVGDAAVRREGADWYRTYPHLTASAGSGMENDALIQRMRQAWVDSEGQTSGDHFRSVAGFHVPGIQPAINFGLSFANGLLDGSTLATGGVSGLVKSAATPLAKAGIPLASKYAAGVADDIARHSILHRTLTETGSEFAEPTSIVGGVTEFTSPKKPETHEQFAARQATEAELRKRSIQELEKHQQYLATPKTTYQKWVEPAAKSFGDYLGRAGAEPIRPSKPSLFGNILMR